MTTALALGQRGQGNVWPNPAVGCVLVRSGRVLARGWTQPGGRPHAEVHALSQVADAKGATAYVTLEPCAHNGQTGPCATALVKAGIVRCVIATTDPDPRVSGAGIEMLTTAGIDVEIGVLQGQADEAHKGFFSRITTGRPRITLKLASSLDGRIATQTGDSQWITGALARRRVHLERSRHDAVLVGGGTARTDDPSLTVRGLGITDQPVRIVASRNADFNATSLLKDISEVPLWVVCGNKSKPAQTNRLADAGATILQVPVKNEQLDLAAMAQSLGQKGLTSVYCEGGGKLAASLLAQDLVDDLIVYTAGVTIGGDGLPSLAGLGIKELAKAPRFELASHEGLDGDLRSHWKRT